MAHPRGGAGGAARGVPLQRFHGRHIRPRLYRIGVAKLWH